MKNLFISTIMLTCVLGAMAQDNKPAPGSFGIGYAVYFLPTDQQISFTYMIDKHFEIGGALGLGFSHNRSSTFDSLPVVGTNFVAMQGNEEIRTVTTSTSFTIEPVIKYHFTTKNNLDIYAGANLPVGVSSGGKKVVSDIITASNYNSTGTETTKPPVTATIGAGIILGCRYFFYQNLAIGAEANVGFTASIQNGNDITKTAVSNSGSNNPEAGFSVPTVTTKAMVKNDDVTLGMLHRFAINLTWYFGKKTK